jgi:hypothetical protein
MGRPGRDALPGRFAKAKSHYEQVMKKWRARKPLLELSDVDGADPGDPDGLRRGF